MKLGLLIPLISRYYRAAIKLAGTRQSRWQGITRHQDHAADDCRWQALLSVPLIFD
jgi:hypothetical protein